MDDNLQKKTCQQLMTYVTETLLLPCREKVPTIAVFKRDSAQAYCAFLIWCCSHCHTVDALWLPKQLKVMDSML